MYPSVEWTGNVLRSGSPGRSGEAFRLDQGFGPVTVITSPLLEEAEFFHGFGTRLTRENDLPFPTHILSQVHGNRIVCLGEQARQVQGSRFPSTGSGSRAESRDKVQGKNADVVFRELPIEAFRFDKGDALITSHPGISIGIRTADCLPALLVDPDSNTVAAVHCGWRSLALDLALETIETMTLMTGNGPSGFLAALGPAINACCYEVGPEIIEQFQSYENDPAPSILREGRHFLNLRAVAKSQLIRAGLPPDHIDDLAECTACQPEQFYSHRARGDEERMVSFIKSRD
ncbi:peptidoglycan editing factor PgeF [bacterium]|nr:MAG: peptidoglycan editing factor PgeF [bacterium]